MPQFDTAGLLSLIAGGANAGINSAKAAQEAAALKLQLAQIPVQGRLQGQVYGADQRVAGQEYNADHRLTGTEYSADSRAGTATDKLGYDITDAVGTGEIAPEDGMAFLSQLRHRGGGGAQAAASPADPATAAPVNAPQSFWNYKAPGISALAAPPEGGATPLGGLHMGPAALAKIGAAQAKTNTAGDKSDVNFENTVGLLPASQQATFVQQWNQRNGTQYAMPGAQIGARAVPTLGPGPEVDGKPTNLPDAQIPVLAQAYQPNGLQASTIDLHGAQAGVDRARVPLITNQAELAAVNVRDRPYLDRSTINLHSAQGKALGTNAGANAYRAQVYGQTAPILAGAAAQNANSNLQNANTNSAKVPILQQNADTSTYHAHNPSAGAALPNGAKNVSAAIAQEQALIQKYDSEKQGIILNAVTATTGESRPLAPGEQDLVDRADTNIRNSQHNVRAYQRGMNPVTGQPLNGGQAAPIRSGQNGVVSPALTGVVQAGGRTFDHLHPQFAVGLNGLMAEAKRQGINLGMTDGFRSYNQQVRLKAEKPVLAAAPGTSNHGWGTAADLSGSDQALRWAQQNAGRFGLSFPMLTRATGHKYEPWHVELNGATGHHSVTQARHPVTQRFAKAGGAPAKGGNKYASFMP